MRYLLDANTGMACLHQTGIGPLNLRSRRLRVCIRSGHHRVYLFLRVFVKIFYLITYNRYFSLDNNRCL